MNGNFHAEEMFGFAEYSKDSKFYGVENEKVIAKMKDKVKGIPMVDFVGLNPKMYSFKKIVVFVMEKIKELIKMLSGK